MPSTRRSRLLRLGFQAAGATNVLGITLFSKCFTNDLLALDAEVFSPFSQKLIFVWGLVFFAAAPRAGMDKALAAVFAVEKAMFVVHWAAWLLKGGAQKSLLELWRTSPLTAVFYSLYGVSDALAGCVFAAAAF